MERTPRKYDFDEIWERYKQAMAVLDSDRGKGRFRDLVNSLYDIPTLLARIRYLEQEVVKDKEIVYLNQSPPMTG